MKNQNEKNVQKNNKEPKIKNEKNCKDPKDNQYKD